MRSIKLPAEQIRGQVFLRVCHWILSELGSERKIKGKTESKTKKQEPVILQFCSVGERRKKIN